VKSLSKKTVLLTGASGGMGCEFARRLMDEGARLIITDVDEEKLDELKRECSASSRGPGEVLAAFGSDISTAKGCRKVYENTMAAADDVDLLINNAGLINYGYFWEIPEAESERLLQVNLMAPVRLSRLFLPGMVERGSGHIVFMCSVAGFAATSLGTPYVTSKFGIRGFAMALSGEMKDKELDVTIVYPSWVRTGMLESPEYGSAKVESLSSRLVEDPAKVVKEAIKGIRKNKLHVCPGIFAKLVWHGAKAWPIVSRQSH